MSKKAVRITFVGWMDTGDYIPVDSIIQAKFSALEVAKTNPDDTAVDLEFVNLNDDLTKKMLDENCNGIKNMRRSLFGDIYKSQTAELVRMIDEKTAKQAIREACIASLKEERKGEVIDEDRLQNTVDFIYKEYKKPDMRPRTGILWYANNKAPKEFKKYLNDRFDLSNMTENSLVVIFEPNRNNWTPEELQWGNQNNRSESRQSTKTED